MQLRNHHGPAILGLLAHDRGVSSWQVAAGTVWRSHWKTKATYEMLLLLLPWLLLLPTPAPVLAQYVSFLGPIVPRERIFSMKHGLPLFPWPPNTTFVNPTDSNHCRTHSMQFSGPLVADCDLTLVQGDVVAPVILREEPHPALTNYYNARSLQLVDPCSVVQVRNSTITKYVQTNTCKKSLVLEESRADTLYGSFFDIRIAGFNVQQFSVLVERISATGLVASNVNIKQESSSDQVNNIVASAFERANLNFTDRLDIVRTNISRLGDGSTLTFRGTPFQSFNIIDGCNMKEMLGSSVIIERGAPLVIHNTTIDSLGTGAIVLGQGSTLKLQDVVIRKSKYGALFVIEPSKLVLTNVTVAGNEVSEGHPIIHRMDSDTFVSIYLTKEGPVCPVKDNSTTCDLTEYSKHVRVSWTGSLQKVALRNAANLTLVYTCSDYLTAENIRGTIFSVNADLCPKQGDLSLSNSQFGPVHISQQTHTLRMVNVTITDLMVENVTDVVWSNVEVVNVDLLSLHPNHGLKSTWNRVTIASLYSFWARSSFYINNTQFHRLVGQFVIDHPGQRSIILNSAFSFIARRGIHLKRGTLELSGTTASLLMTDAIYVEKGAKLILENITLTLMPLSYFNQRIISVDTLDQVEYLSSASRRALTRTVTVRREEDVPTDHHFAVSTDLPQCKKVAHLQLLECDFTKESPSRVFVGGLRQSHVVHLRVTGADHVTVRSPCVNLPYFENIGYLDLLEDSLECSEMLLIDNSVVNHVIENTVELHLENVTTPIVQMGEHTVKVVLNASSVDHVFVSAMFFKCVGSTIGTFNKVDVSKNTIIGNNTINNIAQKGFVIRYGATGLINGTSISSLEKQSLNVLGDLTIENTNISLAVNNSIVLFKNSRTVFRNVRMSNFASHSLTYRQGAQITFINVTFNGVTNLNVFQRLMMLHGGDAKLMGDNISHFLDTDNATSKSNWFPVEVLPNLPAGTTNSVLTPTTALPFAKSGAQIPATQPPQVRKDDPVKQTVDDRSTVAENNGKKGDNSTNKTNRGEQGEIVADVDAKNSADITTESTALVVDITSPSEQPTTSTSVSSKMFSDDTTTTTPRPRNVSVETIVISHSRQSTGPSPEDTSYPEPVFAVVAIVALLAVAGVIAGLAFILQRSWSQQPSEVIARFSGTSEAVSFAHDDDLDQDHQEHQQQQQRTVTQDVPIGGTNEVDMPASAIADRGHSQATSSNKRYLKF